VKRLARRVESEHRLVVAAQRLAQPGGLPADPLELPVDERVDLILADLSGADRPSRASRAVATFTSRGGSGGSS